MCYKMYVLSNKEIEIEIDFRWGNVIFWVAQLNFGNTLAYNKVGNVLRLRDYFGFTPNRQSSSHVTAGNLFRNKTY